MLERWELELPLQRTYLTLYIILLDKKKKRKEKKEGRERENWSTNWICSNLIQTKNIFPQFGDLISKFHL